MYSSDLVFTSTLLTCGAYFSASARALLPSFVTTKVYRRKPPTYADAARPYESDTDLFQSLSLGQSKEAGLSEEGPGVGPLKLREKGKGPGRANVDDQDN